MFKKIKSLAVPFFLATILLFLSGTAMAQDAASEELDADALIQQFLPEDVTIETATDDQLLSAVSQACSANPQAAARIVSRAVQARPDLAPALASAAATAAPDQAVAITIAAVRAAPDQAQAISNAVSQAVPAQATAVQQAAQETARTQQAQQAIQRAQEQAQQLEGPSRDDEPASPVN